MAKPSTVLCDGPAGPGVPSGVGVSKLAPTRGFSSSRRACSAAGLWLRYLSVVEVAKGDFRPEWGEGMQMMEELFTTLSPRFCLALAKLCCISPISASVLVQIHLE